LINAAYTKSTWDKHRAAITCYQKFETSMGKIAQWPLNANNINEFCSWAISEKKLKHSTVESYISSIATLHKLKGMDYSACDNFICKLILRGAENMTLYGKNGCKERNVMSLPLLKILGNEISITNWSMDSKQLIWTASVIAFFGSCRMGELLAVAGKNFDPATTLLWKDLKFNGKSWLIHIKSPKSRIQGGEYIDIFPFEQHNCCPVKALLAWQKLSPHAKYPDRPVFMFENATCLTKQTFNITIKNLLCHKMGDSCKNITGHSFRAGIPSMLAKFPELASDSHIMGWGRWCSKAYLCYTRLKIDQKFKMFRKIVHVLNLSMQ